MRIEPWRLGVAAFVLAFFVACAAIQHVTWPNGNLWSVLFIPLFWAVVVAYPFALVHRSAWKSLAAIVTVVCAWPLAIVGANIASSCDPQASAGGSALASLIGFFPVEIFAVPALWLALFGFLTAAPIVIGIAGNRVDRVPVWLPVALILVVPLIYWLARMAWYTHGVRPGAGICMGL